MRPQKVGLREQGTLLQLCQAFSCGSINIFVRMEGLGQEIPLRFLLIVGKAVEVVAFQIAVIPDVPVQILQQAGQVLRLGPQVLATPLQKRAELSDVIGRQCIRISSRLNPNCWRYLTRLI